MIRVCKRIDACSGFSSGTCKSNIWHFFLPREYYLDFIPKSKYLFVMTKKKLLIRPLICEIAMNSFDTLALVTLRTSVLSLTTYLRSKKVPLLSFEWLLWNSKAANQPDSKDLIGLFR